MAQYDNTCKVLVEEFTADIVEWLLGETIVLTTLESTELLADPIYTDSLALLQSENLILHLEFVLSSGEILCGSLRYIRQFLRKAVRRVARRG